MTAVYLPDVLADYSFDEGGVKHRYGCSGIDGTAIGPIPGAGKDSPSMLMVAYGIYRDLDRKDNDCQVILQYDWRKFADVAKPLSQLAPHHEGLPADERYFVYTGNTTYGIQNLEYDPFTGDYFAAVYEGKKPEFPNYRLFVIDGAVAPAETEIPGLGGERGRHLAGGEAPRVFDGAGGLDQRFRPGLAAARRHGSTISAAACCSRQIVSAP